jgi:hypothetical protein
MPMTKNFTNSQLIDSKNKTDDFSSAENLNLELGEIQKVLDNQQIQAPQKSVDFILNFSKTYKTEKLNNGDYAEMIIN